MCHGCLVGFVINGAKIKIGFQYAERGFYLANGVVNGPLHLFIFFIQCGAQQVAAFVFFNWFLPIANIGHFSIGILCGIDLIKLSYPFDIKIVSSKSNNSLVVLLRCFSNSSFIENN